MVKIRLIKTHIGFAYSVGKEYMVPREQAKKLVDAGCAVMLHNQSELPHDFPGYKPLLENGFKTFNELKSIATLDQLIEIKGIGEKLAGQILQRLEP